ncbi:MAG TPA: hypothetical protein VEB88_03625 [Candidatus Acidoferrales bacterium]|nr:hypothetical protein [Candidatus Acidoferrales bacterium]
MLRLFDKNDRGSRRGPLLRISLKRMTNELKKHVAAMRGGGSPIERREGSRLLAPQIPDSNGV